MVNKNLDIQSYDDAAHRFQVIKLWQNAFGYETSHNEPNLVINKKLALADDLFFIAKIEETVVGTVMAGYDGHRGWIYLLAVDKNYQKQGIGSALLRFAEKNLVKRGCIKINLQIMAANQTVKHFYAANGFEIENRISMGKKLFSAQENES